MIKRLTPWVFLLLLLCIPQSALSQTASITGTVKDSTGAAVPQAQVTTHNRATSASRSTVTDDSGNYRITSLSPGNYYDVVIEKPGFKSGILAGGAHGGPRAESGCHACAEQRQRKSDGNGRVCGARGPE